MSYTRQIYLLDPRRLSPETIAVTFAKTSRSPESFREIAAELTDEKSAEFHEKWVVGYGHASVAEHAVLHIAVENVSRLAVEALESNRLASYTEKSTRFQKWACDAYYFPPELIDPQLVSVYRNAVEKAFEAYKLAQPRVREALARENPRKEDESESAYDRRLRTPTTDVCRFLLPAASLANLGMTANARVLEHSLQKLLSDPLAEVRAIGLEIKQVAQQEAPTLVKYADRSAYIADTGLAFAHSDLPHFSAAPAQVGCRLIDFDPEGETRVLAAVLYKYCGIDYDEAVQYLTLAGSEKRAELAHKLLGGMGPFDTPLRELEHTYYTFDVIVDQGGYFEIKRHRMMTQTPQPLTTKLGYALPRLIEAAGLSGEYTQVMQAAQDAYVRLEKVNPSLAAYVVPNGFNRRVLLTLNLREAFQFCRLRSAANAHFSVRRIARQMAEQITAVHPLLGSYLALPAGETWQSIEEQYFTRLS
jgi:thymidylate synthase ThyX